MDDGGSRGKEVRRKGDEDLVKKRRTKQQVSRGGGRTAGRSSGGIRIEEPSVARKRGRNEESSSAVPPSPHDEEIEDDFEGYIRPNSEGVIVLVMHCPKRNPRSKKQIMQLSDLAVVRDRREHDPYNDERTAYDPRFWTTFHENYYETVILPMKIPVEVMQWVDWKYMANEYDDGFDEVIEACEAKGMKEFMSFDHDWSEEVIAQFYATLHVDNYRDATLMWMTNGVQYKIKKSAFAAMLGISSEGTVPVHREQILSNSEIAFMYEQGVDYTPGTVTGMLPYYQYMNKLLRATIGPKGGDASRVQHLSRNLLARMRPGADKIDIMDYIFQEMVANSKEINRRCYFAPYIQYMIDKKSGMTFEMEVEHNSLKIRRIKANSKRAIKKSRSTRGASSSAAGPSTAGDINPIRTRRRSTSGFPPSTSSAPRSVDSTRSTLRTIVGALKSVFTMCRKMDARQKKDRATLKKIEKRQVELFRRHNFKTNFPIEEEEEESSYEPLVDPFEGYSFDYGEEATTAARGEEDHDEDDETEDDNQ